MSYISLSQAFDQWQELIKQSPVFGQNDEDTVALSESWNDYTDSLCKDGQLCELQYHYAPAYDEEMPGDGWRFDPLSDDREFILDAMGVTVSCVFVSWSASRNKAEKQPSLNWRVTLKIRDREVVTTDYMQGSAHCPAYKNPSRFANGKVDQWKTDRRIADECNTGRVHTCLTKNGNYIGKAGKLIDPPSVVDIMHALLNDSSVLNAGGFTDWCSELGFNPDSINHKAIYDACVEIALKLRAAFGDKTINELNQLFEGM